MRRVVRGVGTTFITVGVLILLFVVYELVGTNLITKSRQNALAKEFEQVLDQPVVAPSASPSASASPSPKPVRKPRTPRQGIARIRIPKIGLSAIVVEGTTLRDLAYGPGHYRETAAIGAAGSAAIAGHRTGWGQPFFNLDKLGPGDDIFLDTSVATYRYRVTGTTVVHPDQSWVLGGDPNSKAEKRLTLTTCTPKFTARDRLIVWADLISTVPRGAPIGTAR